MKKRRNCVKCQPPPKDVAETLYNTFYAPTLRQVLAVTGNEDLATEATQEAFVRAFEQFGTLRNQDRFSSWVVTIALNVARDKARKKSREITVDPHIFPPLANLAAGQTAEETALARDETQSLTEAFQSLPEELKEVTLLFYVQDLGIAEIARLLQLPEGTVKSRLSRARKKLRETLEPDA